MYFRTWRLTCWTVSNAVLIAAKLPVKLAVEFATITNASHSAVCKSVTAVTGNRIFPVSDISMIFNTITNRCGSSYIDIIIINH